MRFSLPVLFLISTTACSLESELGQIDPDPSEPADTAVPLDEVGALDPPIQPTEEEPDEPEEPVDTGVSVDTGVPLDTGEAPATCSPGPSCEVRVHDGRDYLFCFDEVAWDTARTSCEAMGDGCHLATAADVGEDAFLLASLAGFGAFPDYWWFGLTDATTEGTWEWIDGTAMSYANWGSGEPNNLGGEDCGHLFQGYMGWNDMSCAYEYPYVCEAG